MNEEGYCPIDDVLMVLNADRYWSDLTKEDILQIVKECPKQRYEVKGERIRARYGHSATRLSYDKATPPPYLYHGTYAAAVDSIFREGIRKMNRKYVHLSEAPHFAALAGKRRGVFVLLKVDTLLASQLGVDFYFAGNEVWLSEDIPVACIEKVKEEA